MINDQTFDKTCAQLAESFDKKKKELEHLKSESRSITLPSAIRNFALAGALVTCGYFAYVGFQPIAPIIGALVDVVLFPPALVCSMKCLKKISETINPDQIIDKVAVMELLNEIQGNQNEKEASKNILRKIAFESFFSLKKNYDQTEEEKNLEALINIGRIVGKKVTLEKEESLSKTSVFKEAKEFFNVLPLSATNLQEPDIEQGNSREEKRDNLTLSGELKNPSSTSLNPNQNQQNKRG